MESELNRLSREIDKAKTAAALGTEPQGASPMRVGVELVAGVIVGAGLGLLTDRWLGTSPLFLIVFFILGTLGAGMNIYRLAKSQKISDKDG